MARPLLNLHFPLLAGFTQPLAGEFAARRGLLEALPFPVGYGVEIAVLIDALDRAGSTRWPNATWERGRTVTSRCASSVRWRSPCSPPSSAGWKDRAARPEAST